MSSHIHTQSRYVTITVNEISKRYLISKVLRSRVYILWSDMVLSQGIEKDKEN